MAFITGQVRVRASGKDKYAGLKGADYIKARGLGPKPNHHVADCPHCAMLELLPAVQRICAEFKPARQAAPVRSAA